MRAKLIDGAALALRPLWYRREGVFFDVGEAACRELREKTVDLARAETGDFKVGVLSLQLLEHLGQPQVVPLRDLAELVIGQREQSGVGWIQIEEAHGNLREAEFPSGQPARMAGDDLVVGSAGDDGCAEAEAPDRGGDALHSFGVQPRVLIPRPKVLDRHPYRGDFLRACCASCGTGVPVHDGFPLPLVSLGKRRGNRSKMTKNRPSSGQNASRTLPFQRRLCSFLHCETRTLEKRAFAAATSHGPKIL